MNSIHIYVTFQKFIRYEKETCVKCIGGNYPLVVNILAVLKGELHVWFVMHIYISLAWTNESMHYIHTCGTSAEVEK